jgi:hypothetical protein
MNSKLFCLWVGLAVLWFGAECRSAEEPGLSADRPPRKELGRSVKLRILVDKVMRGRYPPVKATAEAGFNVFTPRYGFDNLEYVRECTQWCAKHGIYHMPWMRATLDAPKGPEADGKRFVWADGTEQLLWSPNSDEFWEWTNKYIVEYAKISAEMPAMLGVFLDYENYGDDKKKGTVCYRLSYDDIILGKFTEAESIKIPQLKLAKRRSWLVERRLHEKFAEFQINHWRERCRALRQAVDKHNPQFRFCVYPGQDPFSTFITEACYPEWATQQAPLIVAGLYTSRSSGFIPQERCLEMNRDQLLSYMTTPQKKGIPFVFVAGSDPIQGGDAEFHGKNAVMGAETTDGYWVFYEGLWLKDFYEKEHPKYWKWFTWANRAVASGKFEAWHEPRQTVENSVQTSVRAVLDRLRTARLVLPKVTGEKVEYPAVRMRFGNVILIAAKAGKAVEVVLHNPAWATPRSPLMWSVAGPSAEHVASGKIPSGGTGTVSFTPAADGVFLLGASAGGTAYSVVSSNTPVGLYASQRLGLVAGGRFYFKVPEGVREFDLTAWGRGAETMRLNVLNPEGIRVATGQTTADKTSVRIKVPTGNAAGKVWSLETAQAEAGAFEDNSLQLGPELPPVLSLRPEDVFGINPSAGNGK